MSFPCPHCGEELPEAARSCPHCGSDAETGWLDDEEIDYQSLDLPGGHADSGEDLEDPGHGLDSRGPSSRKTTAAAVLLLAFLLFVSLGFETYGGWIVYPAILLAGLTILFLRVFSNRPPPE